MNHVVAGSWSWRRGKLMAALAVAVAGLLTFHHLVPNRLLHLGSLLETVLLWLVLVVPVLVEVAVLLRSLLALVASLLPVVAWCGVFGGAMLPATDPFDVIVVQHNVNDVNPDPAGTARALAATRPDLIGLVEVTVPAYGEALAERYPYAAVRGTVGLWSRYPLVEASHLDIKPTGLDADWNRGLRAVARTPHGDVAVYVVHLPSVRLSPTAGFNTTRRDDSARKLSAALKAETLSRTILIGDLNSTVDDRGLRPVSAQLTCPPAGFALSWPAAAPVARVDQVMARGAEVTSVRALPRTTSDHLPIAARVKL
jgi:vancomycin resistance protein VanJ